MRIVTNQIWNQVSHQIYDLIWNQSNQVWNQVWIQTRYQIKDQIWHQINIHIISQVRG